MKKIMLSLVLGILVLGFVSATISGMAVSVSEDEGKSFSFNERSYSVAVSESSSGNAYLEVNGEKIENAQAGDSIVVDGAEVIVKKVRKPWLFRKGYKFDLEVKEGSGTDFVEELKEKYPENWRLFVDHYQSYSSINAKYTKTLEFEDSEGKPKKISTVFNVNPLMGEGSFTCTSSCSGSGCFLGGCDATYSPSGGGLYWCSDCDCGWDCSCDCDGKKTSTIPID